MTYDSPLSAFGGEVISEVATFIEEGLMNLEYGNTGCGVFKRGVQN